jgi:hypothetical protein
LLRFELRDLSGLPLRETERAVRPPQRLEFGERYVLESLSLKSVVGVEKDQIGVTYRCDQLLPPLPVQRERPAIFRMDWWSSEGASSSRFSAARRRGRSRRERNRYLR